MGQSLMADDPVPPVMLMDDLSKMNKVEGDEFMLWSKSEMLTYKVRTLVRCCKIYLIRAAG